MKIFSFTFILLSDKIYFIELNSISLDKSARKSPFLITCNTKGKIHETKFWWHLFLEYELHLQTFKWKSVIGSELHSIGIFLNRHICIENIIGNFSGTFWFKFTPNLIRTRCLSNTLRKLIIYVNSTIKLKAFPLTKDKIP